MHRMSGQLYQLQVSRLQKLRNIRRLKSTNTTVGDNRISNRISDSINSIEKDNNKHNVRTLSQMPGPWPSLPLIGTQWQYWPLIGQYQLFKLHEAYCDKFHKYGPIFKEEYARGKAIVHLCDPKHFEIVFRSQGKCPLRPPNEFVRHYRLKNFEKYPNIGIAHMVGEEWLRERQILAPVLMKQDIAKDYILSQNHICRDFIDYLKHQMMDSSSGVIEDFRDSAYCYALESIWSMCLGAKIGCFRTIDSYNLRSDHDDDGMIIVEATIKLFEAYQKLYYGSSIWKWIPTKAYKNLDIAESIIYETVSKYINKVLKNDIVDNNNQHSIVDDNNQHSILKSLFKVNSSIDHIKITIIDFIAGGIFTVSNALTFLLYHLAKNSHVQEKLYNELLHLLPSDDSIITYEQLSQMSYLRMCIKESFRLTSTIPGIMRILTHDLQLSGYDIPAGTLIFTNFIVAGKSAEYFPNPEQFQPERWSGNSKKNINPFAHLPFGYGNRMCIGRRYAQLQLEMASASLIRKYRLSLPTDADIDMIYSFLMIPDGPMKLSLSLRENQ